MCKKGDVAACILYVTNGISLLLSLVGLAVGIWLLVANTAVTNSFPDYLAIAIVVSMALVALIGGLGVFATVAQMKENRDNDPNTGADPCKEKCCSKDCCNSCGISLFAFTAIVGSLLALVLGILALYYSGTLPGEVTQFYANTTVDTTVNTWFSTLDTYIDNKVNSLIEGSVGGTDWIATQDLLGCCGWDNVTADPSVYLTGDCCTNANGTNATLVDSLGADTVDIIFGDSSITLSTCNLIGSSVMTCKGVMYYHTQSNLMWIGVVLLVLFFVLLTCFICALIVRYCAGGQGKQSQVNPAKTDKNPKVDLNKSAQENRNRGGSDV